MQNWYKNLIVDVSVPFQLPYMQIWTALSYRDYTNRSSSPLKYIYCTPWSTEQTYCLWKLIDTKLDMCDANDQKHQFSNLPAY